MVTNLVGIHGLFMDHIIGNVIFHWIKATIHFKKGASPLAMPKERPELYKASYGDASPCINHDSSEVRGHYNLYSQNTMV